MYKLKHREILIKYFCYRELEGGITLPWKYSWPVNENRKFTLKNYKLFFSCTSASVIPQYQWKQVILFLFWSNLPDAVRYCCFLWKTEYGSLTLKSYSLPVRFCSGFGIPVLLHTVLLNTMTWYNGLFTPIN